VSYSYNPLSPARAGSIIKCCFNPKLAKPRMGLHFSAMLRRLIEGWILRSSWLKYEIQESKQLGHPFFRTLE
jgi:hypothetical protein